MGLNQALSGSFLTTCYQKLKVSGAGCQVSAEPLAAEATSLIEDEILEPKKV